MKELKDIKAWWLHHSKSPRNQHAKPAKDTGYRVLLNGPAAAGKIAITETLGKEFGKEVYRVDLSRMVSKYIGETEKNLDSVFKKAESKDWILFFDEADALFGKRTSVGDSHDKYANQEINHFLQRAEHYPGLVIISTNLKGAIDDTFIRRFQTVLHFPNPDV